MSGGNGVAQQAAAGVVDLGGGVLVLPRKLRLGSRASYQVSFAVPPGLGCNSAQHCCLKLTTAACMGAPAQALHPRLPSSPQPITLRHTAAAVSHCRTTRNC